MSRDRALSRRTLLTTAGAAGLLAPLLPGRTAGALAGTFDIVPAL